VKRQPLVMVLRGCHPDGGHFLPARKPARRRAGWDLTLAAPKSVSLLAALTATGGPGIAAAHAAAVDEVVGHFERRLLGRCRPGEGLIAAAFDHTANAAGEPHLHTHLIVCNLGRSGDGGWSPISREWWPHRASFSAIYQLGLRHHLCEHGMNLEWRMREDGFADVVGVPRAAVRVASGRGRTVAADRARFGDHTAGRTAGIRATATGQTRTSAPVPRSPAAGGTTGFGPVEATRIIHEAGVRLGPDTAAVDRMAARLVDGVRTRLAAQRSCFRQTDVLVALAACAPTGLSAAAAERWVDRFCEDAHAVPGTPGWAPRWTTGAALAADRQLLMAARHAAARRSPTVDGDLAARVARNYPYVPPAGVAAAQVLVSGSRSLVILGAPAGRANLLAHAGMLEVASAIWWVAGQRAVVATSSEQAATRWRALTSMDRYDRTGTAEVVVVDHADRRATADLTSLLQEIDQAGARALLIEGGTSARLTWRRSAALTWMGDALGRLDPGPEPAWADLAGTTPAALGVARCPTSARAVGQLLTGWADAWTGANRALLVGLGYAEADGLNQAARTVLLRRGCIGGPGLAVGSRLFQAGDQVLALRRLAADLPAGTFLDVLDVDPRRGTARVAREGRGHSLERAAVAHLGYGYAATPGIASRGTGPLMILGPPDVKGLHRTRVVAAALVTPTRGVARERAFEEVREPDRDAGLAIR
jgi:conjugative relaxase-like TrwC/TraI family protein